MCIHYHSGILKYRPTSGYPGVILRFHWQIYIADNPQWQNSLVTLIFYIGSFIIHISIYFMVISSYVVFVLFMFALIHFTCYYYACAAILLTLFTSTYLVFVVTRDTFGIRMDIHNSIIIMLDVLIYYV